VTRVKSAPVSRGRFFSIGAADDKLNCLSEEVKRIFGIMLARGKPVHLASA
jgi:hypothetical protein